MQEEKKMPFTSKAQLRQCYYEHFTNPRSKRKCDESLMKTINPLALPYDKTKKGKDIPLPKRTPLKSKVYKGPRGGYYFYAKGLKIYIPKSGVKRAIKELGKANF